MAPWELLFLEIVPRAELKETVAIGARWYREPQGASFLVRTGESSGCAWSKLHAASAPSR